MAFSIRPFEHVRVTFPSRSNRALRSLGRPRAASEIREVLSGSERKKLDTSEDRVFYDMPRLVKHVDDSFLGQVTELYRQRIPQGGVVLDLCSSWVSHLPNDVSYSKVVGHGMNAQELARNSQLDQFFVRDLNKDPDGWALADKSFDAVVCCVSIQYLQQPERVLAEIYRVLKPGGICIFTFSNRMFYTKAIGAWRDASDYSRVQLVKSYFNSIPGFTAPEVVKKVVGKDGQQATLYPQFLMPLINLLSQGATDPFFAVLSYRNFKPEAL